MVKRFKNKTFVVTFLTMVAAFVYQLLGLFEITPAITQDQSTQFLLLIFNILGAVGVLLDPTTPGIKDGVK